MADQKGPSKTKLVTDLNEAYVKLNRTLEKTKDLSASIYGNLQGLAGGKGSGGGGASSMYGSTASSTLTPQQIMGGGGSSNNSNGTSLRSAFGSAAATMAGAAVTAASQAVSSEQYINNRQMTSRFGFYAGGGGTAAGSSAFNSMSQMGNAVNGLDAANAAMLGNSNGLMSGLSNYKTVAQSAASVSNIMPGVGLEGGMGAVAALNQGSSVNKLRMIGINVRNQNGMMRDIESIARDLWKMLMNTKSSKGKITAQDLSFSLQSGNSLDMMLNQYFGNDAVLRQSIISYLYQFAQEGGTALSYTTSAGKASLLSTGAQSDISQSAAARQAAGYNLTDKYTSAGIKGIIDANKVISDTSNQFAKLSGNSVATGVVSAITGAETYSGAGNGAGGSILTGLTSSLSDLSGSSKFLSSAFKAVGIALAAGAVGTAFGELFGNTKISADGGASASGSGSSDSNPYTRGRQVSTLGNYTIGQMKFDSGKGASKSEITWAETLLKKLNIAPNQDNVAALVSWKRNEGAGGKNNPLNSTFTVKGSKSSTSFDNPSGVQDYSSEASGIAATALNLQTIKGVGYDKILKDLSSGSRDQILTDVANSQWSGNSHYGGGSMVHINLPNVTKITDTELQKTVKSIMDQINSLGNIRVK